MCIRARRRQARTLSKLQAKRAAKVEKARDPATEPRACRDHAKQRLMTDGGLQALSVRRVAREIGATVRAVYSLFSSKDGLVVALGTRSFNLLSDGLDSLPTTDDPAGDLVEAGVVVFRRFTLSHPARFTIGFLQIWHAHRNCPRLLQCSRKCTGAPARQNRTAAAYGPVGTRSEAQAGLEFDALCEGLAALESRCLLRSDAAERTWRDALRALIAGWAAPG